MLDHGKIGDGMSEKQGAGIWQQLRRLKREKLDSMERKLLVGRFERREFAGDPNQPRHFWVKTRNK